MCEPISTTLALLGAGSALFGGGNKASAPPPAAPPVIAPLAATKDPNADVKVGDGVTKADATSTPQFEGFTEKRQTGTALGGLGRSGLGL